MAIQRYWFWNVRMDYDQLWQSSVCSNVCAKIKLDFKRKKFKKSSNLYHMFFVHFLMNHIIVNHYRYIYIIYYRTYIIVLHKMLAKLWEILANGICPMTEGTHIVENWIFLTFFFWWKDFNVVCKHCQSFKAYSSLLSP